MALFEPEEAIGKFWHRLVGDAPTYPHYPEAAVALGTAQRRLGVIFRALGGSGAVRIVSGAPIESGHRLNLKQRIGLGREKMDRAALDSSTLRLPASMDVFPAAQDNEALYEWLAAWFAHAAPPSAAAADPLQSDILRLRAALATTKRTLSRWPGLTPLYRRLSAASLAVRPTRRLRAWEAEIEMTIRVLLGEEPHRGLHAPLIAAILGDTDDLSRFRAPPGYLTFLPAPIWGEVLVEDGAGRTDDLDEQGDGGADADPHRRRAARRPADRSSRGDPLLLHRFETLLSASEMVNANRRVEDDDEKSARQTADDLSEITIGTNKNHAATRLKLDLDLAPGDAAAGQIKAEFTYPEWDWKRQAYHPNYCRVLADRAPEAGEDWRADEHMQRRIRQVRRQFEALQPRRRLLHAQPDGEQLDICALVRDVADRRAGGSGSERIYVSSRASARDLSVALLIDVSSSTDAWLQGRRVLDVEKCALLAFTHGLTACGDEHAIYAFTSRRRSAVRVLTVKGFEERLGARVVRRIQALKPGQYTRTGAAVRHVASRLKERAHRQRLLLILTDGKPNDIDHYEGRYGVEDTRKAIREARKLGLCVFGVTVDEEARDYFPHVFGRGAYAIFPHIGRLPVALPAMYRQITG